MISRQRSACRPTSESHDPSGQTGAVPETTIRSPRRTALEKPMLRSNGDPDCALLRSMGSIRLGSEDGHKRGLRLVPAGPGCPGWTRRAGCASVESGACPSCNSCELITVRRSSHSNWRTAAISWSRSPTGAMSTSTSSTSGSTNCWPSRRRASAQATCLSTGTARSWAGSNLYRLGKGEAEVGYRLARRVAGRGASDRGGARALPARSGPSRPAVPEGGDQ